MCTIETETYLVETKILLFTGGTFCSGNWKVISDLIHLGEVKYELLQSKWKTGALKRILLINFPYNHLINYFRKMDKEKQS